MNIEQEFEKQEKIIQFLNENLSCEYNLSKRNIQLAHLCFDLTIEHHAAICLLYKSGIYGSMFALLRSEFETFIKGLWLNHVADEELITKFEKEDIHLGFGSMIDIIEGRLGTGQGALKLIKKNSWQIFSSFTHGGYQALVRRQNKVHTGSVNYDEKDIIAVLRHAGLFALLSGVELSVMTNNNELINEVFEIYQSYGR